MKYLVLMFLIGAGQFAGAAPAELEYDIADKSAAAGDLLRLYGSDGQGTYGVPLAGGFDADGDGHEDVALALMTATPQGRFRAGEVLLLFGDGTAGGAYDAGADSANILHIHGAAPHETAGSEVWMDDVTGDGLGDLLICRQNYTPAAGRIGAGALTIIKGGPELRAHAATLQPIDLAAIPAGITYTNIVGANQYDRMGMWIRTGDVTGDGIADLAVGADQTDGDGSAFNCGELFLVQGGSHLGVTQTADMLDFGSTALAGKVCRILPPPGSSGFHFGSTNYIADLDNNGRGEVLISAALNRAGATLRADGASFGSAEATGGSPSGTVFILWDDNFTPATWSAGFTINFESSPGSRTTIDGKSGFNDIFGEELAGGVDFDGNGLADLFIGDFKADGSPGSDRISSGVGYVFYDAVWLKNQSVDLDNVLPPDARVMAILGPNSSAIGSDTVAVGDFDGDGIDDLAVGSPHANPNGRTSAGSVHILYGTSGGWPLVVDTAPGALPDSSVVRIAQIDGALGQNGGDRGDTLCYSAAAGDMDGDGKTDLIVNEMVGNGLQLNTTDVGNLLVIPGADLLQTSSVNSWFLLE